MAGLYKGLQQNMPHGKRSIPMRHVFVVFRVLISVRLLKSVPEHLKIRKTILLCAAC